ncbi:unnamed protein product [Oikopleura dioica]|uniref:SH2 domain-containing protein n=1 Tax=Oikopleura dioica TaxID=34765 RepID=E4XI15_OIKDI|nr:unnamed protein product [Oikopleura dioica]
MPDSDYEEFSDAESESLFSEDSVDPALEVENDNLRRQLDNLKEFIEEQNLSFTTVKEAIKRHPAKFSAISRDLAAKILHSFGSPGSFILRKSETLSGVYAITIHTHT